MSKTHYIKLKGRAFWAMLNADNPDEYAGDKRWKITLVLDDVNAYIKSGLQLKLKDIDGGQAINLRRGCKKLIGEDLIHFTPPLIIDSAGKWIRYFVKKDEETGEDKFAFSWNKGDEEPTMVGEDMFIPNGSEVEVSLAVYETQKGKGHRLESVKILHLAENMPATSANQEIEKAAEPTMKSEEVETKGDIKAPW
jgi:hypothetical protein